MQVRFASRSADELCDQVTRFGDEIGPHLTRDRAELTERRNLDALPLHAPRLPRSGVRARVDRARSTPPRSSSTSGPTRNGFDLLVLSEHHGIDDGWQPAPLTMAGVVLGAHASGPG